MCSLTAQCSDFNLDKQKVGTQCSLNPSVVLQTRARSTVFLWTLTDHQRSSAAFIETDVNRHFQDVVRVQELWLPAPKPDKLQEMSQFNHTNRLHVRILFIRLFGLFLFPELGDTTVSPDHCLQIPVRLWRRGLAVFPWYVKSAAVYYHHLYASRQVV